jgi:hypothetical protein
MTSGRLLSPEQRECAVAVARLLYAVQRGSVVSRILGAPLGTMSDTTGREGRLRLHHQPSRRPAADQHALVRAEAPDGLNFGRIAVDQVDVYGFYTGIVWKTAHTQISHAFVKWCFVGFGLTGRVSSIRSILTPRCLN